MLSPNQIVSSFAIVWGAMIRLERKSLGPSSYLLNPPPWGNLVTSHRNIETVEITIPTTNMFAEMLLMLCY